MGKFWVVAIDDHPTECSVALPGIWTWPNNGMILWLQEERYSQSRGALAMSDPRILSVTIDQWYCTNCCPDFETVPATRH